MNVCAARLSCCSRTLEEENGCLSGRYWWRGLLLLLRDLLLNLLILAIVRRIYGHATRVIVSGMEGCRASRKEEIARHTLLATGVKIGLHSSERVWRWGRTVPRHWLRRDSIFSGGFLPPPNVVGISGGFLPASYADDTVE